MGKTTHLGAWWILEKKRRGYSARVFWEFCAKTHKNRMDLRSLFPYLDAAKKKHKKKKSFLPTLLILF
jgi:hypothetical protein